MGAACRLLTCPVPQVTCRTGPSPVDRTPPLMRRVAVVGAGVTGLVAAHALHRAGLDVTLYEKEARLGGHADTRTVHDVDVGTVPARDPCR